MILVVSAVAILYAHAVSTFDIPSAFLYRNNAVRGYSCMKKPSLLLWYSREDEATSSNQQECNEQDHAKILKPLEHRPSSSVQFRKNNKLSPDIFHNGDVKNPNFIGEYKNDYDDRQVALQESRQEHTYNNLPEWQAEYDFNPIFIEESSIGPVLDATTTITSSGETLSSSSSVESDQILLVNAAAAEFFSNCLRQPLAGNARYYLRSCGISAQAIAQFVIGFAPEPTNNLNFTDLASEGQHEHRCLVNHLRNLGFTPNVIIDAGLAFQIKDNVIDDKKRQRRIMNPSTSRHTDAIMDELIDDNSLVDRFRGHLMVPIHDLERTNILGFCGYSVPLSHKETLVKCVYTPDSIVFRTRQLLFGQHLSNKALRFNSQESITMNDTSTDTSIIIVEGCMKAITLWSAGIQNILSTIGSSVTAEQLSLAAKLAIKCRPAGGRIVLCLDADETDIDGTEKICTDGMLLDAIRQYEHGGVEFYIPNFPPGITDPVGFLDSIALGSSSGREKRLHAAHAFKEEVLSHSVDWIDWYTGRIIRSYDPKASSGEVGEFNDVIDRIALFLANACRNEAEQVKHASVTASEIYKIVVNSTSPNVSDSVRVQLESDLIDTILSRINKAEQLKLGPNDGYKQVVNKMASPEDLSLSFRNGRKGEVQRMKAGRKASTSVGLDNVPTEETSSSMQDSAEDWSTFPPSISAVSERRNSEWLGVDQVYSDPVSYENEKRRHIPASKQDQEEKGSMPTIDTQESIKTNNYQHYDLNLLKGQVDLISVIESFHLEGFRRTSSGRAVAICPFHNDHNPSLQIDATNLRMYKCFACGAGGDVFKFIQGYSNLPGWQGPKLSYGQAIQYVVNNYLDGTAPPIQSMNKVPVSSSFSSERREMVKYQEGRILLANVAAADFYANKLRQPFAGKARHYLRSRGLTAQCIAAFCIGFAPDCYFTGTKDRWGEGSLAHHLRDLGFTPNEIIDAGLAIRTKKSKETEIGHNTASESSRHNLEMQNCFSYDSLMDRFRDRLVVPIFDQSGKKILGFGGRVIPFSDDDDPRHSIKYSTEDFTQQQQKFPKYLNSPESIVFEKKRILFGQHLAEIALSRIARKKEQSSSTNLSDTSIVLVEGYMDAITLWAAGVQNVAATMGTALSAEQLDIAADAATRVSNGRVILCLDNDEAGVAAIKRICNNGMLIDTMRQHAGVQYYVSSFPKGIKDPAEFIESKTLRSSDPVILQKAAVAFKEEILEKSLDWIDWYLSQVIQTYNRNVSSASPIGFGEVFECTAEFLAKVYPNSADRIKKASSAAIELAKLLGSEESRARKNSTPATAFETARGQVEWDLIDRMSQIVRINEAVQARNESVFRSNDSAAKALMSDLARGHGPTSRDDEYAQKLSIRAVENVRARVPKASKDPFVQKRQRVRIQRSKDVPLESLTPHFSGFRFEHKSDRQWLDFDSDREWWRKKDQQSNSLVLGYSSLTFPERIRAKQKGFDNENAKAADLMDNFVYFNSVEYNGRQFLTEDAIQAGYNCRSSDKKIDLTVLETGITSLVEQDLANIIREAENVLLSVLVRNKAARTTVKNLIGARSLLNFGESTETQPKWSTQEKQWLFECLLGFNEHTCGDLLPTRTQQLRQFLATVPDIPPGSFCKFDISESVSSKSDASTDSDRNATSQSSRENDDLNQNITEQLGLEESFRDELIRNITASIATVGTLDPFFDDGKLPAYLNTADDYRSELLVQELCGILLWASTAMQAQLIGSQLAQLSVSPRPTKPNDDSVICSAEPDRWTATEDHADLEFPLTESDTRGFVVVKDLKSGDENLAIERGELFDKIEKQLSRTDTDIGEANNILQKALVLELQKINLRLQAHTDSLKRIRYQLIDKSANVGRLEGHLSNKLVSDLGASIDAFLADNDFSSPKEVVPEVELFLRNVEDDNEPYEDAMERMHQEWGDWFDEDYIWSPNDCQNARSKQQPVFPKGNLGEIWGEEDDTETIEEALARIEREWGKWDSLDDD